MKRVEDACTGSPVRRRRAKLLPVSPASSGSPGLIAAACVDVVRSSVDQLNTPPLRPPTTLISDFAIILAHCYGSYGVKNLRTGDLPFCHSFGLASLLMFFRSSAVTPMASRIFFSFWVNRGIAPPPRLISPPPPQSSSSSLNSLIALR